MRSFKGIPEISYSWVTMSMPVGAALLLVTTVLKVRDELSGMRHQSVRGYSLLIFLPEIVLLVPNMIFGKD